MSPRIEIWGCSELVSGLMPSIMSSVRSDGLRVQGFRVFRFRNQALRVPGAGFRGFR